MNHSRLKISAALLLLAVLTLVFFWKILLTNLILTGVDVFLYFYPYKAYVAEALRQGRLPLWNPHLFMGAPLLANSQVGLFYPFNWLFIWLSPPKQVAWSIGLHIALAAGFMFLFAFQALRLRWSAALIAAIVFGFGGYLGAQVEHINQLQAAAWLPLLFLLYELGLRRQKIEWLWFLLLSTIISLMLLAGHAQTVFIAMVGLGLYALWQALVEYHGAHLFRLANNIVRRRAAAIETKQNLWPALRDLLRCLLPLGLASLLAVALAAVQLLPTVELSGLSIRSAGLTFQEVVSFSLRPTNLHYSLLPPLGLDLSQPLGQAFSEWVAYIGITGLALAALGGVTAFWQPQARRFVFLSAVGLSLSFGLFTGPLYLVLYYFVPGFDLFRVPARWLLLYAFGMSLLAGLGFQAISDNAPVRLYLRVSWRWLAKRRWRLGLVILPLLLLLALLLWKTPPVLTLIAWAGLAASVTALLAYHLRAAAKPVGPLLLALLLLAELFWAAQALNYNEPTAPQAYHSLRNSIAFLQAQLEQDNTLPPDRFLSLSGITYDPGDLQELQNIFGDFLSPQALYNLIVATKEKEVLFFNLPLVYGLYSVDGYDGGILPLARFITFQRLFLPIDDLSIDGRLREKLRFVPDSALLSMINTRWVITDKQFDAWIDGIFYDLQFPARLLPGQRIATTDVPEFSTTALGLVSHLDGAAGLPTNAPVANVIVTFAGGQREALTLRAGRDTAEGVYTPRAAHEQAPVGVTWPYGEAGVDYISVQPLSLSRQIVAIDVEALLPTGQFVLRGLSLIHQPTNTSRSVLLSTEGDYKQVHSGDVKIYENRSVLPRAFVVHQAVMAPTDAAAIEALQKISPRETMVQVVEQSQSVETIRRGQPSPADTVTIIDYAPERIEIEAALETPGWLVLTDTHYPGWTATVNGQPAEILEANILFRAMALPAGRQTVIFTFKPASVGYGAVISGIAWGGVIGALAAAHVWKSRRIATFSNRRDGVSR